jgi:hypothetical protein
MSRVFRDRLAIASALILLGAPACDSEEPYAPCEGVTCSDRGVCVETDASPRCECDEGFEEWGLSCVPEGYDAG